MKYISKGHHYGLSQETQPTPGDMIQPVQVALQDGDPNISWRPFGDDFVQVILNIVMRWKPMAVFLYHGMWAGIPDCHNGNSKTPLDEIWSPSQGPCCRFPLKPQSNLYQTRWIVSKQFEYIDMHFSFISMSLHVAWRGLAHQGR